MVIGIMRDRMTMRMMNMKVGSVGGGFVDMCAEVDRVKGTDMGVGVEVHLELDLMDWKMSILISGIITTIMIIV